MNYQTLRLNNKADLRLRNGHLWVYSNEVDNNHRALKSFTPGELAIIENSSGKTLGLAYVNPNTLICGRLLNRTGNDFDKQTLLQRIQNALSIRQQLFNSNCYRLIYGESDFLPGLVVDRFYDLLVVQISTAGMEKFLPMIVECLEAIIKPAGILIKNDGKMRDIEGLSAYINWEKGTSTNIAQLEENDVKFIAPIVEGQKTGWFYDHRMIRARLKNYVVGKRVLDVFSYIGGWGIQASAFGASNVVLNDASDLALQYAMENAKLNNLQNVSTIKGDAFTVMDELFQNGERFDVVILDPPALIPRRKDIAKGTAAYQKANLQALRLLTPNGILVSGSCSMHLPAEQLRSAIGRAAGKLNKTAQILEQGHQGPDHPIHPAIPETEYLKSFIAQIAPTF